MSLLEISVQALRARRRHLEADFVRWCERTEKGDLKQHHTQVYRITDTLRGALEAQLAGTGVDPGGTTLAAQQMLEHVPDWRRSLGSVYLLWEFFRGKLAQRNVESYEEHLGAADDLAWACVEPFVTAIVAAENANPSGLRAVDIKTPPLVFYGEDRTPFAQARTKTFYPEGLDSKDYEQFAAVVLRLPVPIIGLPWSLARRLPELVLVGHEAGHVVAEDFGLAGPAKALVADLTLDGDDGSRAAAWAAWSDEIFADVFGVVATGSAFVASLCAELVAGRDDIRTARIHRANPGHYPPPSLRVALCERVLHRLHAGVSPAWRDTYGKLGGDSLAFAKDVEIVADALFDAKWPRLGDKTLFEVLPWSTDDEGAAGEVGEKLLRKQQPSVGFSARRWVAGAVRASLVDPCTYAACDLDVVVAKQIVSRRPVGVRSLRSEELQGQLPTSRLVPRGTRVNDRLRRDDEQRGAELAQWLTF